MKSLPSTLDDVEQTIEQIQRLYRAVADLEAQVGGVNPAKFRVLAEGPLDQIRALTAELDSYAASLAGPTLWLRLEGPRLHWPEAPTSVLAAMLEILRKGVQAVAEFTSRGALATRPTAALKRACDLQVVAMAPGSLQVGLRAPGGEELAEVATAALDTYLAAAAWAGSDQEEASLAAEVPDAATRRLALTEVGRLVPRHRGDVDRVELSGSAMGRRGRVSLERATRLRIGSALAATSTAMESQYTGQLREIDLDRRSFILRKADDVTEIPCEYPEELMEAAKEALDKRVQVTGTKAVSEARRAAGRLLVTRMEILDIDDAGSGDSSGA